MVASGVGDTDAVAAMTRSPDAVAAERREVVVRGVVQGVGFRPFVYALAAELGLSGEVGNTPDGVHAVVQGRPGDVEAFCARVADDAPPLAQVTEVTWRSVPTRPGSGFVIAASASGPGRTLVPPDVATCAECLRELVDPADRRYRHPFITCTACGPRFTIVTGLPYDRPATTMAPFALCPECEREYHDPADRRFHAQPVSCHACGPVLELVAPGEDPSCREDALLRARRLLAAGAIVAVKGIGGYHLACDATDPGAVSRLRARKRRGDKPFAVMVADLATARAIALLDPVEEALLTSPRRPIVVLRRGAARAAGPSVAAEVAPGIGDLGIMLPPTGLHHLLLGIPGDPPGPAVLVLTSGNLSGEPIVTDDDEAVRRLGHVADAWLRHDRGIHVPCDDSVVRVVDGTEVPLRRSRGYAPMPVALPVEVPPMLAVGGDLKNTFCVAQGRYAWLSAHVGDMDNLATQQAFDRAVEHLGALVRVEPQAFVADRHPGYRSAGWAVRRAGARPVARVQHHHAHVAAVMAEHGLDGSDPVLGFAFDGTGYGDDGAVWGAELLLAGYTGFERLAHLGYVPLAGGDTSVLRPYRMALAHLRAAGLPWDERLPCVAACPPDERAVLARQLETGLACVPTSSMGRLFDAVASLAGVCHRVGYEAQAAMELEAAGDDWSADDAAYPFPLVADDGGTARWEAGPLIEAVVADVLAGGPAGQVSARFHRAVADATVAAASWAATVTGVGTVVLSGGAFANALLLSLVCVGLRSTGLEVLCHAKVPPNDGGLALGQVVVGAHLLARGGTGPT